MPPLACSKVDDQIDLLCASTLPVLRFLSSHLSFEYARMSLFLFVSINSVFFCIESFKWPLLRSRLFKQELGERIYFKEYMENSTFFHYFFLSNNYYCPYINSYQQALSDKVINLILDSTHHALVKERSGIGRISFPASNVLRLDKFVW